MSKTYTQADNSVTECIAMAMHRWHPVLAECEVSIDALFIAEYMEAESDDGELVVLPALEVGGHSAAAQIRIHPLKDRVKGLADAELVIDLYWWERHPRLSDRLARLDHELTHLQVKALRPNRSAPPFVTWDPMEKTIVGMPDVDDSGRPQLKLRKHDFVVGGFHEVARRHQERAVEVREIQALQEGGQFRWVFDAPLADIRERQQEDDLRHATHEAYRGLARQPGEQMGAPAE